MARGINLRAALRLPADWPQARVFLERWGTALPLGSAGFHVTRATNASSIPDGTTALLPFTVVLDDAETWYPNGAGSTTTLTVPRSLSGLYALEVDVAIGAAQANWSVLILVNGVAVATSDRLTSETRREARAFVLLNDGDELSVSVSNGSGVAITPAFLAASASIPRTPFFRAYRLSLL
jgi:hypothetical protein